MSNTEWLTGNTVAITAKYIFTQTTINRTSQPKRPWTTLGTRYQRLQGRQQREDASVCVSVFQVQIDHLSVCYSERGRLDLKYWSLGGHAPPPLWPGLRRSLFATTLLFDRGRKVLHHVCFIQTSPNQNWGFGLQWSKSVLWLHQKCTFTFKAIAARCIYFWSHPALVTFVWSLSVWERETETESETWRQGYVSPCSTRA